MGGVEAPGARGGLARGLAALGRALLGLPLGLAWTLALAWGLLIFGLSSQSVPTQAGEAFLWELFSNLAHAPLFGILTVLVGAALLREPDGAWPRLGRARVAAVLALALGYGVLDELHQGRVAGRDASPFDVLTDALSACLVLWIVEALGRRELPARALWARLGASAGLCLASAVLATLA